MSAADGNPSPEDELRANLLELAEQLAPIYEFAAGQKAQLERQGWSPAVAESAGHEVMLGLIRLALSTRGV